MKKRLVWDIPVRLFHWLLVASLIAQWVTAEWLDDAISIHFYIGYFTLGLVLFRIIWGFLGTRYARFGQFITTPIKACQYLSKAITPPQQQTVGHNPAGGWMIIIMLALVLLQAVSGLFMSDDIFSEGPYYSLASESVQNVMSWLHHNVYNVLMGIAAIHIGAILFYKFKLKQNLTLAMITGKKAVNADRAISSSAWLRALIIALLIACLVYWLVFLLPPAPVEDFYY